MEAAETLERNEMTDFCSRTDESYLFTIIGLEPAVRVMVWPATLPLMAFMLAGVLQCLYL